MLQVGIGLLPSRLQMVNNPVKPKQLEEVTPTTTTFADFVSVKLYMHIAQHSTCYPTFLSHGCNQLLANKCYSITHAFLL